MKRFTLVLLVVMLAGGLVYAQEKATTASVDGMRVGMGVSFGKETFPEISMFSPMSLLDFPTFYVPIQLNSMFRVEPEFGLYRVKMTSGSSSQTISIMCIGAGILYTKWYGNCDIYAGGRLQYFMWKQSYSNGTSSDSDKKDLVISPVIGAEAYACKHVSFGGEVQFNIGTLGNWEGGNSTDDEDVSFLKTKGLFFIRWWF